MLPSESTTPKPEAKFVTGSTMRHVVVMTSLSSIGLMTLFLVDFADMYFLSLLGEVHLAAAIGYAGTILFFTTSICIGLAIAAGALVARSIGAGERLAARKLATSSLAFAVATTVVLAALIWIACPALLSALGADGRTHELALSYLRIIVPTMPLLGAGMICSTVLRANGDAKRAMYVTLSGGVVNAVLDPIFIFSLGLGIEGAAWASVAARIAVFLVGLNGVLRIHNLLAPLDARQCAYDFRPIAVIAIPAMLTNIATPVGNAYITVNIAPFGDGAMAGWAIIGRVVPVAFGAIFSLSGAIGPIVGQNFGARRIDRVRSGFTDALIFALVYVATTSTILYVLKEEIASFFSAGEEASNLIFLFCTWIAVSFLFNGSLFIANAVFNNLGKPHYSTVFNWGKATLGTIPFVHLGGLWFGAGGVIAGQAVGAVIFGIAAAVVALQLIEHINLDPGEGNGTRRFTPRIPLWPHSTHRGFDI